MSQSLPTIRLPKKDKGPKSFAEIFGAQSRGVDENSLQGALVGASKWLDLLCTMLFDPESYELKKAVYGVEDFGGFGFGKKSESEMHAKLSDAEEAQRIVSKMPAGPERDLKVKEIISRFVDGTAINADTLLQPDLLLAIKDNPEKQEILDAIIKDTSGYNLMAIQDGKPELDPHVVANWLWSKSKFNITDENGNPDANMAGLSPDILRQHGHDPEHVKADPIKAITAAIDSLGAVNNFTGNEFLAVMIHDNGGFDFDGDGIPTFVGPNDYSQVMAEVCTRLAADRGVPESEIDLTTDIPSQLRHMREIMGINTKIYTQTIQNVDSNYWGYMAKIERAEQLMKETGYEVTSENDVPADDLVKLQPDSQQHLP